MLKNDHQDDAGADSSGGPMVVNLYGTSWSPRLAAAEALGNLGPKAKAAIPALERMLDDKKELDVVKVAANEALRKIKAGKK